MHFSIIIIRPCRKVRTIARAGINTHTIPNIIAFGEREIAVTNQALAD